MSVNLEQTAMLSWNTPEVINVPKSTDVPQLNTIDPNLYTNSPMPSSLTSVVESVQEPILNLVIEEQVEVASPDPAITIINEPVVSLPVNNIVTETVVTISEVEPVVLDVVIPADVIIPLEGTKPAGDITQEDLNDATCSPEETQTRLAFCKTCPKFKIENMITKCSACDCSISMVSTFKYKACPLGNW